MVVEPETEKPHLRLDADKQMTILGIDPRLAKGIAVLGGWLDLGVEHED